MSRRLALASAASVMLMAAFVLFGTRPAAVANHDRPTSALVEAAVPVLPAMPAWMPQAQ